MEICAGADEEEDDHEKGLEFEDAEHGGFGVRALSQSSVVQSSLWL